MGNDMFNEEQLAHAAEQSLDAALLSRESFLRRLHALADATPSNDHLLPSEVDLSAHDAAQRERIASLKRYIAESTESTGNATAAWEAHKRAYEIVRAELDDLHRTLTQCGVPEQIPPFKTALAPAKARVLYLSARCNQLFDEAADAQERLDQFDAYGMPDVAAALDRISAAESRLARAEEALRDLTSEPDALAYPLMDVYREGPVTNGEHPFWSEGGLYGRVGKEAARTLLAWHARARAALAAGEKEEEK